MAEIEGEEVTGSTIVIVGDLHCGSEVGVKPPGFKTLDVNTNRSRVSQQNGVQERIWECLEELHSDVPNPDYLIVNGDLCDGIQTSIIDTWTHDGITQAACACKVIEYLNPKKVKISQGSGFHTGFNPSLDAFVAAKLQSKMSAEFDDEFLFVAKGSQTKFHVKHYVGVSEKKANRSTGLASEIDAARRLSVEHGRIDVVIRSHAHYFHSQRDSDIEGIITPGLKGKDAFNRKGPSHYIPELGYCVFHVDQDGYEWYPSVFALKGENAISVLS